MKFKIWGWGLLLLLVLLTAGCNLDLSRINSGWAAQQSNDRLLEVEIVFTDGQVLSTYIRTLGIGEDAKVLIGGSSVNYFYDQSGNVKGVYNYQRVLYINFIDNAP